jgi:hypothetical protein
MEWWSNGVMRLKPNIPILHDSNIPLPPNLDGSAALVIDVPIVVVDDLRLGKGGEKHGWQRQ